MKYCILPSGNKSEFPKLDAELQRRGVQAQYFVTKAGGRVYAIPDEDLSKLPSDEKGPYLGDDNSGHAIYPAKDIEVLRREWQGGDWVSL